MIDFVSTREGVDPETKSLARMIAALIAVHLRSLTRVTSQEERRIQRNLNSEARSALQYFFEPGSPFEDHIELIGGSPAVFRRNLLGSNPLAQGGPFTDTHRTTVKLRHAWWTRSEDPKGNHNG
jgi:hypothetical protein